MASNVGRGRRAAAATTNKPLVKEFVPSSGWTEDPHGHYLLVDLPDFRKEQVKLEVDDSGRITVKGERVTSDNKYIMKFEQVFNLPLNCSDAEKISGHFDGGILYVTVPKHKGAGAKEQDTKQQAVADQTGVAEDHHHHHHHQQRHHERETSTTSSALPHRNENDVVNKDKIEKRSGDDDDDDHHQTAVKKNKEKPKEKGWCSGVDSFDEGFVRKWGNEPTAQFRRAIQMLRRNKGIIVTAVLAFSLGVLVSHKFGPAATEHHHDHDAAV